MVTEPLNVKDLLKKSIAAADDDDEWNELPFNTSIGHVHLYVSNLAKAKEFYHEILQLNHTATYPGAISLLQIDIIIILLPIHSLAKTFLLPIPIIIIQD